MRISKIASQFMEGLDYPISKNAIEAAARDASIHPTVQDSLKKLPDREYVDAQDLTQQLNAVA
ncbi:MAG: DUF2795 domain-containing protein [Chloroflexota bacterium]|nr:DUF2795 domain-containing protein [Chloroflexota bacterium]